MKTSLLPAATAALLLLGCTKNYYVTVPPPVSRPAPTAPAKKPAKAPANYSPSADGFQAVTKPSSYSSY